MHRRLRVLHLGKYYPPHRGGIESYVETLCAELRGCVDSIVLVASDNMLTSREVFGGTTVFRAGTVACIASMPICPRMFHLSRFAEADIVHLHLPNPFAVVVYFAALRHKPLVISYHSDIVRQRYLRALVEPIVDAALRHARVIIAASPQYIATSCLLQKYSGRCRMIPYGIRPEAFEVCDHAAILDIKRKYGSRLLISVGRLVPYKGFEYLIRAMAGVAATLLILGDGPLLGELEKVALVAGVAGKVIFLRGVDNVVPYLHAADIFVLPSIERSEAFGIVQLEAMACGTPVINTRIASGVPFVSKDGVSGITVPPLDSAALQSAINLPFEL